MILLICVVLAFGIWTLPSHSQPPSVESSHALPDKDNVHWDRPPFICVNGALYKCYQTVTSDSLGEDYSFLGTIESCVPSHETPSENFQANTPITGAELYQCGNNIIAVNNGWYGLYCPLK